MDKAVQKQKLEDGVGGASMASKRGRKTGGFKNPFAALGSTSKHPASHKTVQVAHLVPPESLPPHPPQSFDAMLPQHKRYDAYMHPDTMSLKPLMHLDVQTYP